MQLKVSLVDLECLFYIQFVKEYPLWRGKSLCMGAQIGCGKLY